MIERIPSGIYGLDEFIQGGFPTPSVMLLLGEPGTGKTTLAMQSLFHGAGRGETVIYMTGVAEPIFMLKKFMSAYEFFDEGLINSGRVQFWDLGTSIQTMGPRKALTAIIEIIKETDAKRVIIDPLPLSHIFSSPQDYRKYLYDFFTGLRQLEVFTLIVGEKDEAAYTDLDGYMVDGIIILYLQSIDDPLVFSNFMRIRKMRGTDHTRNMLAVELSAQGMSVSPVVRNGKQLDV